MTNASQALRQTDLGSSAAKKLRSWARDRTGSEGTGAWHALLVKEASLDVHLPERPLQVYEMVRWSRPPPNASVTVATDRQWVYVSPRFVETGLRTVTWHEGQELARALMVFREGLEATDQASYGPRELPDPPEPSDLRPSGQMVITEAEVAEFARLVGGVHPLHSSAYEAQHQGYPNIVVQAHVLIQSLLRTVRLGECQTVEAWFRRPVPVGAVLAVRSAGSDVGVRSLTPVGRDDPSVILRVGAPLSHSALS